MIRFSTHKFLVLLIVLFIQISPHPTMALFGLRIPVVDDLVDLGGDIVAGIAGPLLEPTVDEAMIQPLGEELRRSIAQLENIANEQVSNLDSIMAKNIQGADEVAAKHMRHLEKIADGTYQRIQAVLQEADQNMQRRLGDLNEIFREAARELGNQRVALLRDFNRLLDEVECAATGQVMTLEWAAERIVNKLPRNLKDMIFRSDKGIEPIQPSLLYEEIKHSLLGELNETSSVKDIVTTYADLEFTVNRIGCAHRKLAGRVLYTDEELMYARKIRFWREISPGTGL